LLLLIQLLRVLLLLQAHEQCTPCQDKATVLLLQQQ
jgi:hypothetical protein